ncbi:MAG: ABC transporter substrate-binding protein [Halococcoides sp.]
MPFDWASDSYEDVIDRRSFTKLAGASGVSVLTGAGTAAGATDETDTDVHDVTVESTADQDIEMLDWSPSWGGWPFIWGRWMAFDRFAQFNYETGEWIPRTIQDWSIEGRTATLHVREDQFYDDGDPVTASDVKVQIGLNMADDGPLQGLVESFTEVDEKTLEIETTEELNPEVLEYYLLSHHLQAKDDTPYDDWFERYWIDGEDVKADLVGHQPEEPDYCSGPMVQDRIDDQQYVLARNEEHPDAENINFAEYRFRANVGNQAKWQAMNDYLDTVMSVFAGPRILDSLSDSWNEYSFPGYSGYGLMFNHDPEQAPHVSKCPVRQAIANAIDRESVATNAGGDAKTAAPTPAAIASNVQDDHIDVGGQFSTMQDPDTVAELMREAGYDLNDDGVWAADGGDGEVVTLDVTVPEGWSDWVVAAETVANDLQAANFDAAVDPTGNGTIMSEVIPNGEFSICSFEWLPGLERSRFPYFPLRWVFGEANENAHSYPGWERDTTVEVPAMDGDGTMEVDIREALDQLFATTDQAEQQAMIEQLAWVSHQDLPFLPIMTKREQSFINTENLSAPDTDAEVGNVKWPCMYLPKIGKMEYDPSGVDPGPDPVGTVESVAHQPIDRLDWNPTWGGWPFVWGRWMTFDRFAQYNYATNEWIPRTIQDWSIDGTTVTLSLRDDHTYANGDPVTASDVKVQIGLDIAAGGPLQDLVDSFTEVDEKTLEIETTEALNADILEFYVLSHQLQAKDDAPYDDWFDRFWNQDEDIAGELEEYAPDDPDFCSGPMIQESMGDGEYVLARHENHPDAANVDFERYRFTATSGNQAKWQAMNDSVDTVMSVFAGPQILNSLLDSWNEYSFPGYWGYGIMFNHDPEKAPHVAGPEKRPVRQAIANAIDRATVADNAGGDAKTPAPTPAAIASNVQDEWIDVGGQFSEMQDKSAVSDLMEEAGYGLNDDGVWADDGGDGEVLTLDVTVPASWSDWVVAAETVATELQAAGFDASADPTDHGTIVTEMIPSGEFSICSFEWLPGEERASFPYFPLRWVFGEANDNAHNYPGWERDTTVEVPAMDGDGTMEVDIRDKLDELFKSRDDDTIESNVQELAWVSHQDLPYLPIMTKREQSFINTENLSAPDTDAEVGNVMWPCMYLPKIGEMQYNASEPDLAPIDGAQPTDPDDDGLYEDISGDGRINFPDVNTFFQNTDSDAVQDHASYYDFTDDGTVDLQDVLALFEMV